MRLPLTKPVELAVLTSAMKQLVPSLEGLSDLGTELDIRSLSEQPFTPAEEAQLQQVLAVHDVVLIRQRRQQRGQRQQVARQTNPTTLSLPERVARLELLLNVDSP